MQRQPAHLHLETMCGERRRLMPAPGSDNGSPLPTARESCHWLTEPSLRHYQLIFKFMFMALASRASRVNYGGINSMPVKYLTGCCCIRAMTCVCRTCIFIIATNRNRPTPTHHYASINHPSEIYLEDVYVCRDVPLNLPPLLDTIHSTVEVLVSELFLCLSSFSV